jgi:hypothetical protein
MRANRWYSNAEYAGKARRMNSCGFCEECGAGLRLGILDFANSRRYNLTTDGEPSGGDDAKWNFDPCKQFLSRAF